MPGGVSRTVCAAALAAVVLAPAAVAAPVPVTPRNKSVAQLLSEMRQLYQQAEEATEAYNGTVAELKQRKAQVKKLDAALVTARSALADSRDAVGRLAREQYQGRSDFSAYLQLLMSRNPEGLLDQEHLIRRAATVRTAAVQRLTGAEKRADRLAAESRAALDRQQTLVSKRKKQRDAVRSRLKNVETMLASLSGSQLGALSRLEQRQTTQAQRALAASGALSSTGRPSAAGRRAVAYAIEQIGKPYVWGAQGPNSFDCSGLTSRAWAKAGRPIPRTSQEQWRQLRKVPVNALRPGDLVIYFPKATHVALYIGKGLVVQAPRPGSRVKVSPMGSNPLLGAVRPDPGSAPLSAYRLPRLPSGAASGSHTGYGSSSAPRR
ncbi:NlpC/P60 family protein [Streptomyces sp. NPDC015144]|uniref:C40 family peptidase n=1 Tax=Streptomyces sp. NPDC015144 TaxID=3364944 RepID=UPI0036FEC63D